MAKQEATPEVDAKVMSAAADAGLPGLFWVGLTGASLGPADPPVLHPNSRIPRGKGVWEEEVGGEGPCSGGDIAAAAPPLSEQKDGTTPKEFVEGLQPGKDTPVAPWRRTEHT